MKKLVSLLLVLALCLGAVCVLTACGEKAPTEATAAELTDDPGALPPAPGLVGGWEVNGEDVEADMPAEAKAAFDKAMEELDGATYTPIAYLGSQIVAGVNYAYLCKTTLVTAEPLTKLTLVKVYSDLEGGASILDIADVEIADYTENEELDFGSAPLAGGWALSADYPAKLGESDQAAFDAATETLLGVDYTPLALMGKQVVAGENLAFLCCAESVTAEPVRALCVVTVYADLEGNFTVTSIAPFPIA